MENEQFETVDLREYVRILWRRRWLVALTFAVAAGAALGFSSQRTPTYEATAKVFIGPRTAEAGQVGTVIQELTAGREFVASYAELLRSRPLAERVVEQLGLEIAPTALTSQIRTRIVPDTRIIEVRVSDETPDVAQQTANTLVHVFVDDVYEDFGGRTAIEARMFEPALTPGRPVSPKPLRDGVLGGILGLMLGIGAALVREQMDTTIRDREDAEKTVAPLPLLATIPHVDECAKGDREIFLEHSPRARPAESFRILRTGIQFLGVDRPLRTVLVTSPSAEEGKSTVAMNLAATMAAAGLRTVIIDADLRRPSTHTFLTLPRGPGLTDVLANQASFASVVRPSRIPGMSVVVAGPLPPNPAELLGSRRMVETLNVAAESADVVIIDTPPALPVTDAVALAPHVDGVLLVARARQTDRERLREAIGAFGRHGARVLGVVLNDQSTDGYYYYDRYYGEEAAAGGNGFRPERRGLGRLLGRRGKAAVVLAGEPSLRETDASSEPAASGTTAGAAGATGISGAGEPPSGGGWQPLPPEAAEQPPENGRNVRILPEGVNPEASRIHGPDRLDPLVPGFDGQETGDPGGQEISLAEAEERPEQAIIEEAILESLAEGEETWHSEAQRGDASRDDGGLFAPVEESRGRDEQRLEEGGV